MRPSLLLVMLGCADPGETAETVGYRDVLADGPDSGERGTVIVSEILWSGSVTNDGDRDVSDVFVEIRNEGNRPVDVRDWFLVLEGSVEKTWRLPALDAPIAVGGHVFFAAKDDGCFPDPDAVVSGLAFPQDAFELTLKDADERLMESAGSTEMPPYAGGYDLVVSRSMERVELMFGGEGTEPHMWHFYTPAEVDVPNRDRIGEDCSERTLASPGRPNSPDYSGAYAAGSFE